MRKVQSSDQGESKSALTGRPSIPSGAIREIPLFHAITSRDERPPGKALVQNWRGAPHHFGFGAFAFFVIRPPVPQNDTEHDFLDLANSYKFNLMGSLRSLSTLFRGFSICFTLAALGFGVLDLALSREASPLLQRAVAINIVWLAAMTAVSLFYFFAAPTILSALPLVAFMLSYAGLRRSMAS